MVILPRPRPVATRFPGVDSALPRSLAAAAGAGAPAQRVAPLTLTEAGHGSAQGALHRLAPRDGLGIGSPPRRGRPLPRPRPDPGGDAVRPPDLDRPDRPAGPGRLRRHPD